MRLFKRIAALVFAIYLIPGLAAAGLWATKERPGSWRDADWSSSRMLPDARENRDAHIYVMAASTGGFKGAFAVHSWIVLKRKGADRYDRYDVVGWGNPVRKNGYDADGKWYSNAPTIVWQAHGEKAETLIPKIEAAIAAYPHSERGSYRLWPGPNSNTFVASILRAVPEIDAVLPPNAVGRDYLAGGDFVALSGWDAHLTLYGLAGIAFGPKAGLEVHFLGLVAGIDISNPGVKIPAFGRIGV